MEHHGMLQCRKLWENHSAAAFGSRCCPFFPSHQQSWDLSRLQSSNPKYLPQIQLMIFFWVQSFKLNFEFNVNVLTNLLGCLKFLLLHKISHQWCFLVLQIRLNQSQNLDIKIVFFPFFWVTPSSFCGWSKSNPRKKGGNLSRNLQNLENMSPLETWKRPEFFLSKFQAFHHQFFLAPHVQKGGNLVLTTSEAGISYARLPAREWYSKRPGPGGSATTNGPGNPLF